MIERFIHQLAVELPAPGETAAEARVRLAERFPRTALRRMTHLGMLLGASSHNFALGAEDAVVYASTYAETRALEDFLRSFPAASPLLFQTSIHPGGIQQVLIGRQQPLARLWPLAGCRRLVEQAFLTALLEPAPRVAILAGEERGTWLLEQGVASGEAFAVGLLLGRESEGRVGRVAFVPSGASDGPVPTLMELARAVAAGSGMKWSGAGGEWTVEFDRLSA